MLARDLITDEIPSLKPTDLAVKALHWMDEFKVHHLPILRNKEYLGVVSDSNILDLNSPESDLTNKHLSVFKPFVLANQHVYDVIKIITDLKLTIIPVLDEENNYLGVISLKNITDYFAKVTAVHQPGGIIVLELNTNDYSLTQIAQIVEGNDAKILSLYIAPEANSTKIEVTLKINKEDLTAILQTFYRYNYTVKATFHRNEFGEELKKRYEMFLNYMKI